MFLQRLYWLWVALVLVSAADDGAVGAISGGGGVPAAPPGAQGGPPVPPASAEVARADNLLPFVPSQPPLPDTSHRELEIDVAINAACVHILGKDAQVTDKQRQAIKYLLDNHNVIVDMPCGERSFIELCM
jgi:hypothetical protein